MAKVKTEIEFTTLVQAKKLVKMFGGEDEPCSITVAECDEGHGGPGLYAHYTDYPEEGSIFLGPTEEP